MAGITRRVRFHDLRHTCASSLVAGWWGRAWRLEEVKAILGHGSVTMTERYAHLAQSVVVSRALS
jgi:integrase